MPTAASNVVAVARVLAIIQPTLVFCVRVRLGHQRPARVQRRRRKLFRNVHKPDLHAFDSLGDCRNRRNILGEFGGCEISRFKGNHPPRRPDEPRDGNRVRTDVGTDVEHRAASPTRNERCHVFKHPLVSFRATVGESHAEGL
jgi:hypothetical protein